MKDKHFDLVQTIAGLIPETVLLEQLKNLLQQYIDKGDDIGTLRNLSGCCSALGAKLAMKVYLLEMKKAAEEKKRIEKQEKLN